MDRGCISSLPFALQNIPTYGEWISVELNDERYGVYGTIKAMISGRDQLQNVKNSCKIASITST